MNYFRVAWFWFAWAVIATQAHGPYQEEIADLSARLTKRPHDLTSLLRRGELYRDHARSGGTNDLLAARADFQMVLTLRPGNFLAQFGLAQVDADAGAWAHALARLDALLAVSNQVVAVHLLRAEVLAKSGQPAAAVRAYTEGLRRLNEPRPETYLARARAQLAATPDDYPAAIAGLDEGIARLGQVPGLQLLALELASRAGDFDRALLRLDQLAAASDRQETWLARRGDLLETAGRADLARTAWKQAVQELDRLPERLRSTVANQHLRESLQTKLGNKLVGLPVPPQTSETSP